MSVARTTVDELGSLPYARASVKTPDLPLSGQSPARFGGLPFESGPELVDRPGVFILTEDINGYTWPLYIGEGDSIVLAAEAAMNSVPDLRGQVRGQAWLPMPVAIVRREIARILVEKYRPPFNEARVRHEAPKVVAGIQADVGLLPPELAAARLKKEIAELVSRF